MALVFLSFVTYIKILTRCIVFVLAFSVSKELIRNYG